ncbi:unnamed protein product, partial [Hapterophycus canaliculatus]
SGGVEFCGSGNGRVRGHEGCGGEGYPGSGRFDRPGKRGHIERDDVNPLKFVPSAAGWTWARRSCCAARIIVLSAGFRRANVRAVTVGVAGGVGVQRPLQLPWAEILRHWSESGRKFLTSLQLRTQAA